MAFRRSQWVGAGLVGAVAVATAVAITLALQPSGSAATGLSAAPLGVNVAPWDGLYTGSAAAAVQPSSRPPGSSSSATAAAPTPTSTTGRPTSTSARATSQAERVRLHAQNPLGFAEFSRQAKAIGAQSLVTVNYGSGTPAQAAAWVTEAAQTAGQDVALWEVGNETYGCWETNDKLAGPPEYYRGYRPSVNGDPVNATCPQAAQGAAAACGPSPPPTRSTRGSS